jgi:hypothetical protein
MDWYQEAVIGRWNHCERYRYVVQHSHWLSLLMNCVFLSMSSKLRRDPDYGWWRAGWGDCKETTMKDAFSVLAPLVGKADSRGGGLTVSDWAIHNNNNNNKRYIATAIN